MEQSDIVEKAQDSLKKLASTGIGMSLIAWDEVSNNLLECLAEITRLRADLTTPDTRDALIKELVGALAFYADKNGDGYDSEVRNYGLSLYTGAIVDDGGECARAALTRAKEAGYGAE